MYLGLIFFSCYGIKKNCRPSHFIPVLCRCQVSIWKQIGVYQSLNIPDSCAFGNNFYACYMRTFFYIYREFFVGLDWNASVHIKPFSHSTKRATCNKIFFNQLSFCPLNHPLHAISLCPMPVPSMSTYTLLYLLR